jgi:predicted MFS family arabinose efflux permease
MAIITALDATDRYSALIPGAQALGALTGPILAGNIIVSQGYNSVLVIAGFIIITASGLFLYLLRTGKNHA